MSVFNVGVQVPALGLRRSQLLLFYCYFGFGVLLQVFPPLLGAIQNEFGLDHRSASLVVTLFLAPMVLVALPAGIAADRLGPVATIRAGQLAMLVGTAVTLVASTWGQVLTGRAIAGLGSGLMLVGLLKVAAENVPREKLGSALGIFAAGLPAGTGIAFNLLRPLGQLGGWRTALGAAGALVLTSVLVFELVAGRQLARSALSAKPSLGLRSRELWRLSMVTVLGYAAIIGFTTWAPTTLVGFAQIPVWVASLIASVLLVVDIPFAPFWGAVSDRLRRRKLFVIAAFAIYLGGSLLVPGIAVAGALLPLVLVITTMGIGCSMFFPAALAIPAETVAHEQAGAAYGLLFTAQVAGMLIGPLAIGEVVDVSTAAIAFLTVSLLAACGLLSSFALRSR
jgi:DHA1 family inner membrane transport protein